MDKLRKRMKQKFQTVKWARHICGKGSVFKNTEKIRNLLAQIVKQFNIYSIADVGAGDLSWIHATKWPHEIQYTGYDLVPRHKDVIQFDITSQIVPPVDLILCRYVLNHIEPDELRHKAQNLLKQSESKYIIITLTPRKESYFNEIWGSKSLIPLVREGLGGRHDWHYGMWKL